VDFFSPYSEVKEPNPDARSAGAQLIGGRELRKTLRQLYLYVNNRLEGNALLTIMAMLEAAGRLFGVDTGDIEYYVYR
jgi:hypothetical protein